MVSRNDGRSDVMRSLVRSLQVGEILIMDMKSSKWNDHPSLKGSEFMCKRKLA